MLDFEITGNYKQNVGDTISWSRMLRRGSNSHREHSENCFYPIFVNESKGIIDSVGFPPGKGVNRDCTSIPSGCVAVWPMHEDNVEGCWQLSRTTFLEALENGTAKLGRKNKLGQWSINYLNKGLLDEISKGSIVVTGKDEKGALILQRSADKLISAKSVWTRKSHDASLYGSVLLSSIIGKRFDFPKSIYAVHDVLKFFVANKPNALIVDFFAGSGTTLHAVNLLNAEEGGKRRCVMVTNNEVSSDEEEILKREGYHPGQGEWDKWGIARYVNWPRTKCSILGVDVDGNPINGFYQTALKQEIEKGRYYKQITLIDDPSSLKTAQKKELVALCCQGKLPQSLVKADTKFIVSDDYPCTILFDINYADEWLEALEDQDQLTDFYIVSRNNEVFKKLKTDIQELLGNIIEEEPVLRPMSDGFAANAQFFKLSFLDKNEVALARQFHELLPLLWMKAGAIGECPKLEGGNIPDALVLMGNKMAILNNEWNYDEFLEQMTGRKEIKTIFIVTDSELAFRDMAAPFTWAKCYQLYRDYLDNFSINYEK